MGVEPDFLDANSKERLREQEDQAGEFTYAKQLVEANFPAYFRLSPLPKHVTNVNGSFGKKSCVSTSARKPGNTYVSPTAMI